jgi:hypothetical protein
VSKAPKTSQNAGNPKPIRRTEVVLPKGTTPFEFAKTSKPNAAAVIKRVKS